MGKNKELSVSAIKEGTVIDHIPAHNLFKVISILGLERCNNLITFGTNLGSERYGKKAIIKVADLFFENEDVNRIALVAPDARLNIIRDYEVVEKKLVTVPDEIIGIAKCFNPKCITNNEIITTKFSVEKSDKLSLKCYYCEKITTEEHLKIF